MSMNPGRRVLLVEDDPKLSYVLSTLLQERGCKVTVCSDADQARLVDAAFVDVAVLDVRLPTETGMQLARHLRDHHPRIKVIFVTGYDDLERKEHHDHGVSVLVKPFSFEALWKLI